MKIKVTTFYSILFVIVVFLQLYVKSFRFNIILQLFILGFFVIYEKPKISFRFLKYFNPILFIFIIGFFGTFFYKYNIINIIKDIFHFIKPLLALLIGYLFYKKINNFKLFVKTIVVTGFISALFHFGFIISISKITNVHELRQHGTDNFLELIALFFLSFYKKFQKESLFISKVYHNIILHIILISSTLYFSRTMIVSSIIMLLSVYGYTLVNKRSIKIILSSIIAVLLLYGILYSSNIQRGKDGITSFLYKIKIAPEEILKTKIDREDHSDLWDHWRGYEAKRAIVLLEERPSGILFGLGYGSLVNLKFYAPLTKDDKGMKYISELHNGYIYMLYKVGIIGLLFYLLFLLKLYMLIYSTQTFINVFISAIGLSLCLTTLVTSGINNSNEVLLFIVGALLYFKEQKTI